MKSPSVQGVLFCSGRHWVGGGYITHHSVNTGGCIFFLTTRYRILVCYFFHLIVGTDIMYPHYVCRVCLLDSFSFLSLGACSDITPVFLDGTTFSLGWLFGGRFARGLFSPREQTCLVCFPSSSFFFIWAAFFLFSVFIGLRHEQWQDLPQFSW